MCRFHTQFAANEERIVGIRLRLGVPIIATNQQIHKRTDAKCVQIAHGAGTVLRMAWEGIFSLAFQTCRLSAVQMAILMPRPLSFWNKLWRSHIWRTVAVKVPGLLCWRASSTTLRAFHPSKPCCTSNCKTRSRIWPMMPSANNPRFT